MFLKKLTLQNFRNFKDANLEFDKVNLLVGNNAQGKSNFLESIYFLATTKSNKATKDVELIGDKEDFTRVEGSILLDSDEVDLEIVMQKFKEEERVEKKTKVNGVSKRSVDYIGNLVVISFSPEDMNLVSGSPSLRRWHIDLTLAQVDREYKKAITIFSEAVTSRNKILRRIREGFAKRLELDFWTEQTLINGILIQKKREYFFQSLNEFVVSIQSDAGFLKNLQFIYHKNEISEERLNQYSAQEVAAGVTLVGPHRDDFDLVQEGRDLFKFGSRGEIRTAILDLKLSELEWVSSLKNSKAILLLDDIFSELDNMHREYVVSVVSHQQTIISAIENEEVPKELLKKAKYTKVEGGVLK